MGLITLFDIIDESQYTIQLIFNFFFLILFYTYNNFFFFFFFFKFQRNKLFPNACLKDIITLLFPKNILC